MIGTTNIFFNNFQSSQEQELLEDLIIESISIYGIDVYYIPRKLNNYDSIYGADDQSSYEQAIMIAMYIKSVNGFTNGAEGQFMSPFGLEIRDQVIFSVAQRSFHDEVSSITLQPRPNEGDLIYFPLNQKCFQIKFVNKFEMFYPLGKLYSWECTCEVFEYSNEVINTGIAEIDILQKQYSMDDMDWALLDESGNILSTEDNDYILLPNAGDIIHSDNEQIQRESNNMIDWSIHDPFSMGLE